MKDYENDTTSKFVHREWTQAGEPDESGIQDDYGAIDKATASIRLVHWNILAQRLADNFDKINDQAPMIQFDNRLRLMKEHLYDIEADLVGMAEVDALSGRNPECFLQLVTMMSELGYTHQYFDKSNAMSASAVFYKAEKFQLVQSQHLIFDEGESQFLMHCLF